MIEILESIETIILYSLIVSSTFIIRKQRSIKKRLKIVKYVSSYLLASLISSIFLAIVFYSFVTVILLTLHLIGTVIAWYLAMKMW